MVGDLRMFAEIIRLPTTDIAYTEYFVLRPDDTLAQREPAETSKRSQTDSQAGNVCRHDCVLHACRSAGETSSDHKDGGTPSATWCQDAALCGSCSTDD